MKINHGTKTIKELLTMKDKIHLNPSWQRGPVWTDKQKSLLIDSILRGYDIPMVYLRELQGSPAYSHEVVDGQQRLRSIWGFIDDDFSLPSNYKDIGTSAIAGKCFSSLSHTLKNRLLNFRVVVATISHAREPEVSLIFSRMQMGVRLIPPELRNAVQSGLRHAIDTLALTHPFFTDSRISSARFKWQDYLAHAFSICHHGARMDLKAPQLMEDYEHIDDSAVYSSVLSEINDILDFLLLVNQETKKRITQKWIFVDLVFLLYNTETDCGKLDKARFAEQYLEFDLERLEHNAKPEQLLLDEPGNEDKDLYAYIEAFKTGGGEKNNLITRHRVMQNRFKDLLE